MKVKDKILSKLSDIKNNEIVYGLWIGRNLSLIEQLSISSFLKNGHKYVLYLYEDIKNIPDNVEVRDANEIIDEYNISKTSTLLPLHKKRSTFANWFRYQLLYKYGGWWADLDMICLKPLDFKYPYVFSSMNLLDFHDNKMVNNGIIKSPSKSPIFKFYSEICEKKIKTATFGETGPLSFYYIIQKYGLLSYIQSQEVFEPSFNINIFKKDASISPNTYTIHLHNSMNNKKISDKNKTYEYDSLIEKLKRKYL